MLNVLIDMPVYVPALNVLQELPGLNVTVVEKPEEKSRPLPTHQIQLCDILFTTFLPENFLEMAHLKLVQISSVGYTQLIGKSLVERGIRACNAQGVFDVPIAEWNIAMMINLVRNLRGMDSQSGSWYLGSVSGFSARNPGVGRRYLGVRGHRP